MDFQKFALFPKPVAEPERGKAVTASMELFPPGVPRQAVAQFLRQTILGPQGDWAFVSIGKNASSSTLMFLYELEFGHPLTASFNSPVDINPSAVVHQLADHGIFARAFQQGVAAQELQKADKTRMMVCRNPFDRAVSAFRYFCKSNETGAQWFLRDRLRIDASVGFDWRTMPGTVEGFRRFLHYIELEAEAVSVYLLNAHWRPQKAFVHPEVYRPNLIGRMEDLGAFYRAIEDRLGKRSATEVPVQNRQAAAHPELGQDTAARRLVERIYAQDFEAFGY